LPFLPAMKYWKRLTPAEINKKIIGALQKNIDFKGQTSLGIPASSLDEYILKETALFEQQSPLLRVYRQNPNHIGCHTLGDSELFFNGTQQLEKELIEVLAVDVLKAAENSCDGYVAAGGTEANLQAAWIYRNYFLRQHHCDQREIALISSSDTHYSVSKAANLLYLDQYVVPVEEATRKICQQSLERIVAEAKQKGKKYFIAFANMGSTMFGSVDDPTDYVSVFEKHNLTFRIHVDGAFGGFIYPISNSDNNCMFNNPHVSSVTLDAHKMLQAPYGTGIFIVRKGFIHHVLTEEAQYVHGMDLTISGSRSGANAVAVWLLLYTYGPYGWLEKINKLLYRTNWLCEQLTQADVPYFHQPDMNIVTINASCIQEDQVKKYGLVPDTHDGKAQWYKVVVMDHVDLNILSEFVSELKENLLQEPCTCASEINVYETLV
jgi:tyrosine decarboxylase / aspartate 1-decarboxylase